MPALHEVQLAPRLPNVLFPLVGSERMHRFAAAGEALAELLEGRTVWNVSLDEATTGVSELVRSVLGYVAGFGIRTRWFVIEADPQLYQQARSLRTALQGFAPEVDFAANGRPFGPSIAAAADALRSVVAPGDLVLLHDPGPAVLAPVAVASGARAVWRCHAGSTTRNDHVDAAWAFLRPHLQDVSGFVFSRHGYRPDWIPAERIATIAPSIDPLSPKNRPLERATVHAVLGWAGVLANSSAAAPNYLHSDGSNSPMCHRATLTADDAPLAPDATVVAQVTRWDPLKDMPGVLRGFALFVDDPDAHLVLAGPDPYAAHADPVAPMVFAQCAQLREALPGDARSRVHLATLPSDSDDSAIIVNALQRHAGVVTQKALAGDQSAAVSEAMLKARPIVASGTAGIIEQIRDHANGILVADPTDLPAFGAAVVELLDDTRLADELRYAAYEDAIEHALPDRHLLRWGALVSALIDE